MPHPNLKKAVKIMEDRVKEKRNRFLSKDPDIAEKENKLFDLAEKVKGEEHNA